MDNARRAVQTDPAAAVAVVRRLIRDGLNRVGGLPAT